MKLFEYIERINLLHKLIKDRKTGNPEKFAKRLGISTVRLYQMVEELKIMQAPICYSKKDKTYYYGRNFEISAKLTFTLLDDDELINLNAGFSIQSFTINNFFKL